MMMIDSSVWIDFFNSGKHQEQVYNAIDNGVACTCPVIGLEIVPFERNPAKRKKINIFFNQLNNIGITDKMWKTAEKLQTVLVKRRIYHFPITDLIIGTACLDSKIPLFTRDNDFKKLASVSPIKLIYP